MEESDFLIKSFRNNFHQYKNQHIAIYGISSYTKLILDHCKDFNIFGLLDGYLKNGEIYDHKIVSEKEIVDNGIKIIVIVARASSVKIIHNRIKDFCRIQKISLYDVNGTDLLEKYKTRVINCAYKNQNYEVLKKQIIKHDVISFDIFDTILMRKVFQPTDVFEIIAKKINDIYCFDFTKERIRAEIDVLSGPYPRIEKIYKRFSINTGLPDEECIRIMELEISTEIQMILPRHRIVDAYNFAIENKKKVYFVSDMYLSREHIKTMLHSIGIQYYEDIIMSCEYGKTKCNGLFSILKNKIINASCLHIGDNYEADVLNPVKYGFSSFEIKKASEMLSISSYYELDTYSNSLDNRKIIGLFIAEAFNDPFCFYNSSEKLLIKDTKQLSKLFIAPIVTKFLFWLVNKIKDDDLDRVLFLARDGYLIDKMYHLLNIKFKVSLPVSSYFLTSRIPCIICGIYREDDIKKVIDMGYDGAPQELLRHRFLLKDNEIQSFNSDMKLYDYVMIHKDIIFTKAEHLRDAYRVYAEKSGVIKGNRVAVFDLAASGTCQNAIEKLLKVETYGYYFVNIVKEENEISIDSLFSISTWFAKDAFICESYVILESILTSPAPTLLSFTPEGEPIYADENRTDSQLRDLNLIQEGILEYFKHYMDIYEDCQADKDLVDKILSFIQAEYSDLTNISMINGRLNDEFYNRSYDFMDIIK